MMKALRYILQLLQLTLPLPLSTGHCILRDLSDKALFELEEAPVLAEDLVRAIQADQQEIGQRGQYDRALYPLVLLGHLHLPQVHPAFQLLNRHLHAPASRIDTENGPSGCLCKIGHDDFYLFRPSVTPFLGQYDRDIAQLMQRRMAHKDPVILATAIGFPTGATGVAGLGEMLDQIAQMFAIGKFARPGHRKHIGILFFGDQPQGLVGRKTCVRDYDHLTDPRRRDKLLQHLPKKDVLMPFDLWVNRHQGQWDTQPVPTGKQHDHLKPKGVRVMLTVARDVPQRMLPSSLVFQRAIPNYIEDAVWRGWQCPQRCSSHLRHHGL